MINGVHTIVYAQDAEKARAFFRDVLKLDHVDAGRGWLIFALPPGEIAAHPAEPGRSGRHELYLMCDDIDATVEQLGGRGAEFEGEVSDRGWGLLISMIVPGLGKIGLYQPKHPTALNTQKG